MLVVFLLYWSLGAGCHELHTSLADLASEDATTMMSICLSDRFVSIRELLTFCGAPGTCGQTMKCEGKTALLKGLVDYDNVFHKGEFPQLPYEKFRIRDESGGESLEVWTIADDNAPIYKKILEGKEHPERPIHVKGVVVGIDMPIQDTCQRWIQIEVNNAESVFFP